MTTRKASIKETGEEISQAEWARFDAAVAEEKAKRSAGERFGRGPIEPGLRDPDRGPASRSER